MRYGILTGGGDCPGLNAAIRAVAKRLFQHGHEVVGIRRGWKGLLERDTTTLTDRDVSGILLRGGTILGASRTSEAQAQQGELAVVNAREAGLDGVVCIGGRDTLLTACRYAEAGLKVVGAPRSIENDVGGPDWNFGFFSSLEIVAECIDRLYASASSHDRAMVVEVMGRHTGWLAALGGIAGGADYVCTPERPVEIQRIAETLERRRRRGKQFSVIVVAEGCVFDDDTPLTPAEPWAEARRPGVAERVARVLEKMTGIETRHTVLGHIQRGGAPTAFDRLVATRIGVFAADLAREGRFGTLASLVGSNVVALPLTAESVTSKPTPESWTELASIFFG